MNKQNPHKLAGSGDKVFPFERKYVKLNFQLLACKATAFENY